MKIIKKAIALILAIAMMLSCSVIPVSAAKVNGTQVEGPLPFSVYPDFSKRPSDPYVAMRGTSGTQYPSASNSNIKYVVTTADNSASAMLLDVNSDTNGGMYAVRLMGKGTNSTAKESNGAVRMSLFIGEKTADNKYVISFDAAHYDQTDQDYAALNEKGWNGTARLQNTTMWTVTDIGTGANAGGIGDAPGKANTTWKRYTATIDTTNAPQLDFAVFKYGRMYIDNIIVKDTSGNVIFTEDFELPAVATQEKLFPASMYPRADGIEKIYNGTTYTSTTNPEHKYVVSAEANAFIQMRNVNYGDGQYAMTVYGKGGMAADGRGSARISLHIGQKTENNKYVISFDATRSGKDWQDYVALNLDKWNADANTATSARLDGAHTQWTITDLDDSLAVNPGNYGHATDWKHYEATLTTESDKPQLDFAVFGQEQAMYVDNVVVKDTSGRVIFTEDFELPVPEEPEVNIYDPFTREQYPSNETSSAAHYNLGNATYTSENNANMQYVVETEGESHVMIMNANSTTTGGKYSLRLHGKGTNKAGTNSSAKISMILGIPKTEDEQYVVSFDAYRKDGTWLDYVALNEGGKDGVARLQSFSGSYETQWAKTTLGTGYDAGYSVGEWSRYTAVLETKNAPQLNFSVNEYGVLFIDNITVWNTEGEVIFREDFEVTEEQAIPEFPIKETYDPIPKDAYPSGGTHQKLQNVEYTSKSNPNVRYEINTSSSIDSWAMVMNANSDNIGGQYSLRIYANTSDSNTSNTKVKLHIGRTTANNKYIVSFDAYRFVAKDGDYVAMNGNGAGDFARLSQWATKTLGAGNNIGNYGDVGEWSRYTAMLTTDSEDPTLEFAMDQWAIMYIDNIVVWDTAGNVIFRENFEPVEVDDQPAFPVIETYDPIPKEMYPYYEDGKLAIGKMQGTNLTYTSRFDQGVKYVINTIEDSYVQVANVNNAASDGQYSLRLYGKEDSSDTYAKISMYLGKQNANNRYVISFDVARFEANSKDYVALNGAESGGVARLGDANCQWTKTALSSSNGYDPDKLEQNKTWDWNRYTATLTAIDNPYLDLAVYGRGRMYIDNIAVWDTQGNLIFSEDFETTDGYALPEFPGVPEEPGVITVHDAVVERAELIENEYVAIETVNILRQNTFVKVSVKIENGTEADTSANVYTALYQDKELVLFDSQAVYVVAGGEMTGSAILKTPSSLEDGEYKLKVFVWDDDFDAIKDVKLLGE